MEFFRGRNMLEIDRFVFFPQKVRNMVLWDHFFLLMERSVVVVLLWARWGFRSCMHHCSARFVVFYKPLERLKKSCLSLKNVSFYIFEKWTLWWLRSSILKRPVSFLGMLIRYMQWLLRKNILVPLFLMLGGTAGRGLGDCYLFFFR